MTDNPALEKSRVIPVQIEEIMKTSYLDYAMSVIVSRALPDVRDGLKPVHRRILYAMNELGNFHTGPYKKSARIVGEVLGKYHPHGDAAVYDAMVRMAQEFSMRKVLIEGQGNFGSIDNDPPAAMRYTEARLAEISLEMLADIDKETVDFIPNFDGSLVEPVVLPARLPNLLVNGSSGIAVGMATNIPPHNLGEICDAISYLIDNPEALAEDLFQFVKGPDFPTAGIIIGREGIREAYTTGRGRVVLEARATIEESAKGRHQIIITELPYQTNKAGLVENIAALVREKKIEGISEIRDESDREGLRVFIELKRDVYPQRVLHNLFRHTALRSSFNINMLALVDGQPRVISLKEALEYYLEFRQLIITRRSRFDLKQAKDRAHILEGLKIALDHLDEVIQTIRRSGSVEEARKNLMEKFQLTQIQAQAILEMQLRRLAALERKKVEDEYAELLKKISYLEDLLANPRKIMFLIKEEIKELKEKHGDSRRTQIIEASATGEASLEMEIPHRKVVVTLSARGLIKTVPTDAYKRQKRGGVGVIGVVTTKEGEDVRQAITADTHDYILFFTNKGKVFRVRCFDIPLESSRTSRGLPLINLLKIEGKEQVTSMIGVTEFLPKVFILLATSKGKIKKTALSDFSNVKKDGKICMPLATDEELVAACLATNEDQVLMVTEHAMAIKFKVGTLRHASRTSGGVKGINLKPGDRLIDMEIAKPGHFFLVVSQNGYGKLNSLDSYPLHNRGGKGLCSLKLSPKSGLIASANVVTKEQELLMASTEGEIIRIPVQGIALRKSRASTGVILMRLRAGDKVASVSPFYEAEEPEKEEPAPETKKKPPAPGKPK